MGDSIGFMSFFSQDLVPLWTLGRRNVARRHLARRFTMDPQMVKVKLMTSDFQWHRAKKKKTRFESFKIWCQSSAPVCLNLCLHAGFEHETKPTSWRLWREKPMKIPPLCRSVGETHGFNLPSGYLT